MTHRMCCLPEDEHIPKDQKRALIEQLWQVVVAFVDLGWSLNPNQQICGETLDLKAMLETMALGSNVQAVTSN